jgi:o-succinylbenzoate synthase
VRYRSSHGTGANGQFGKWAKGPVVKIASLRFASYRVPFRVPYVTSRGSSDLREGLICELTTDDGLVGLGEAAPVPELACSADDLQRALAEMSPRLVRFLKADPRTVDTRRLGDGGGVHSAISAAFDTACCDVIAQSAGLPLAQAFGKNSATQVQVNALVTASSVEEAVAAATYARKDGYRTVKLKVGTQATVAAERHRILEVRDALGPDVALRVDPNGAWDFETAIAVLSRLSDAEIEYVEDPLPVDFSVGLGQRMKTMARLQDSVPMPIASDEEVTDQEVAQRLLDTGAAQVLIVKPQRLGGIRLALGVIETARRAGSKAVVTTSIETGIGTAACLQLAATMGAKAPACGLATASLLAYELAEPSLPIINGAMHLPESDGLGTRLSKDAQRYLSPWRELA